MQRIMSIFLTKSRRNWAVLWQANNFKHALKGSKKANCKGAFFKSPAKIVLLDGIRKNESAKITGKTIYKCISEVKII